MTMAIQPARLTTNLPRSSVYTTVGALVDAGLLPAPTGVHAAADTVSITCATRAGVDAWARQLGMPRAQLMQLRYTSVDFQQPPGWCGYTTLDISCSEARP